MQFMMQQMMQQQQQNQLTMQQFLKTSAPTVKKPTTPSPKYSVKIESFPFFLHEAK